MTSLVTVGTTSDNKLSRVTVRGLDVSHLVSRVVLSVDRLAGVHVRLDPVAGKHAELFALVPEAELIVGL
jgi:hypothetical protein